jgi:hypothetical protein
VKEYPIKLIGGPFHGANSKVLGYEVPLEFVIEMDIPINPKQVTSTCRRQFINPKLITYINSSICYKNRWIFVHEHTVKEKSKTFRKIMNENKHQRI